MVMTRKTRGGRSITCEDWKKQQENSSSYELPPTLQRSSSINPMRYSCWRYHEGPKGKIRIIKGYGKVSIAGENWSGCHGAGMAWGSSSPRGELRDGLNCRFINAIQSAITPKKMKISRTPRCIGSYTMHHIEDCAIIFSRLVLFTE